MGDRLLTDPTEIHALYAVLDVFLAAMVTAVALRFIFPDALREACANIAEHPARFSAGLRLVAAGFLPLLVTTLFHTVLPAWGVHALTLAAYPVFYAALLLVVSATWADSPHPAGVPA